MLSWSIQGADDRKRDGRSIYRAVPRLRARGPGSIGAQPCAEFAPTALARPACARPSECPLLSSTAHPAGWRRGRRGGDARGRLGLRRADARRLARARWNIAGADRSRDLARDRRMDRRRPRTSGRAAAGPAMRGGGGGDHGAARGCAHCAGDPGMARARVSVCRPRLVHQPRQFYGWGRLDDGGGSRSPSPPLSRCWA